MQWRSMVHVLSVEKSDIVPEIVALWTLAHEDVTNAAKWPTTPPNNAIEEQGMKE